MVSTLLKDEISGIVDRVYTRVDLQMKSMFLGLNFGQRISQLKIAINPILGMESKIVNRVVDKISIMHDAVINSVCDRIGNPEPINPCNTTQIDMEEGTHQPIRRDLNKQSGVITRKKDVIVRNIDHDDAIRKVISDLQPVSDNT